MNSVETLRLDQALVELRLAPTRSKAQQLIANGDVEVFMRGEWRVSTQASLPVVAAPENVRVKPNSEILKYVSRGGLKLEAALAHLSLDVQGFRCLDLGISTGGFTDCLLRAGAAAVCGVDVGHGQLHAHLKGDPRVTSFEGVNVKDLGSYPEIQKWIGQGVDLCVADLSFISLLSLMDGILEALPAHARILALIKPQFELGAAALNKAGVVTDASLFADLERRSRASLPRASYFPSALKGQDGNQEFFLYGGR